MTSKIVFIFVTVLCGALAACSGTMDGVVREDAQRIKIKYSGARIGTAEVQVTMPGGERFTGRTQRGQDTTSPGSDNSASTNTFQAVEEFEGNADAVLTGNRGNIMKCRFRITDIIIGFPSGGIGLCQSDDGRTIDIYF